MLADHVARHGELLNTNPELEKRFVELLSRVQKCRQDSGQSDGWAELRQAYAEVTRFTGGVNGHSIRDTDSLGKKSLEKTARPAEPVSFFSGSCATAGNQLEERH